MYDIRNIYLDAKGYSITYRLLKNITLLNVGWEHKVEVS